MKSKKSTLYQPGKRLASRLSIGWQVGICLVFLSAYALAFGPLYRRTGGGVGAALSVIPLLAAGWFWGWRAGVIGGVLLSLINAILISYARGAGGGDILSAFLGPGSWALVIIGWAVGYLRDIRERLTLEIQQRVQIEKALHTKEAVLAEAQRIAHLGHWEWDIITNHLYWSDEIYRIFGVAPQQFKETYEAFLEAVHPQDRAFVMQSVNNALYNGKPYSIDHRIVQPDGKERVVHEQAEVTFEEHGKPVRMLGTVHDITEQIQARQTLQKQANELQRSNALLSSLARIAAKIRTVQDVQPVYEILQDELFDFSFNFILGFWDPSSQTAVFESSSLAPSKLIQLEELGLNLHGFQLKAENLTILPRLLANPTPIYYAGQELLDLLARSAPEIYKQATGRILEILEFGPDTRMIFLPLLVASQVKGFLYFWGANLRQSDMGILSIFANQISIAIHTAQLFQTEQEQRQLAEALQDTSAAITSTLDFDTVMMRILENVGKVVPTDAANFMLIERQHARIAYWHGYSNEHKDHLRDVHMPLTSPILYKMAESKRPIVVPDTALCDDWITTPESGWVKSYLATPVVIHERVIGFLNLDSSTPNSLTKEHIEPLWAFANQAALAIENARIFDQTDEELRKTVLSLEQANLNLKHALHVKTTFMQRMSHELRTPLNAIIGFAGILERLNSGESTQKQARYAGNISSSAQRLSTLVNDVLELTALEAGEVELQKTRFLLQDLCATMLSEVHAQADKKKIHLDGDLCTPGVTLVADPTRLRKVFYILLENAIKFTPEAGQVSIQSTVASHQWIIDNCPLPAGHRQLSTDHWILITVADTGMGIRPDDFDKIFVPFEQLEEPLSRSQGGSGMGLALAKRIVELHKGYIWFKSNFGEGTTFYVVFPAHGLEQP